MLYWCCESGKSLSNVCTVRKSIATIADADILILHSSSFRDGQWTLTGTCNCCQGNRRKNACGYVVIIFLRSYALAQRRRSLCSPWTSGMSDQLFLHAPKSMSTASVVHCALFLRGFCEVLRNTKVTTFAARAMFALPRSPHKFHLQGTLIVLLWRGLIGHQMHVLVCCSRDLF